MDVHAAGKPTRSSIFDRGSMTKHVKNEVCPSQSVHLEAAQWDRTVFRAEKDRPRRSLRRYTISMLRDS